MTDLPEPFIQCPATQRMIHFLGTTAGTYETRLPCILRADHDPGNPSALHLCMTPDGPRRFRVERE